MLTGTLELHDITDVEAFCTTIANGRLRQYNELDQEDLIAYLIAQCWILSKRYKPGGISFSTYAGTTLRRRIIDWIRTNKHDTRYPTPPELLPLDRANTPSPLRDPGDSHTPLEWILPPRNSQDDRPYPTVGRSTTRAT